MTTEEKIGALVNDALRNHDEFRPFVVFDAQLDCVRVVARDCSVTERRVNEILTVLEDNYYAAARGKQYVGFTIKGAKHFCQEQGFTLSTPVRLTEILDRILATFPEVAVRLAVDAIARPLVEETPEIQKIDLSGTRPVAA
jgi:hypothetical protein